MQCSRQRNLWRRLLCAQNAFEGRCEQLKRSCSRWYHLEKARMKYVVHKTGTARGWTAKWALQNSTTPFFILRMCAYIFFVSFSLSDTPASTCFAIGDLYVAFSFHFFFFSLKDKYLRTIWAAGHLWCHGNVGILSHVEGSTFWLILFSHIVRFSAKCNHLYLFLVRFGCPSFLLFKFKFFLFRSEKKKRGAGNRGKKAAQSCLGASLPPTYWRNSGQFRKTM